MVKCLNIFRLLTLRLSDRPCNTLKRCVRHTLSDRPNVRGGKSFRLLVFQTRRSEDERFSFTHVPTRRSGRPRPVRQSVVLPDEGLIENLIGLPTSCPEKLVGPQLDTGWCGRTVTTTTRERSALPIRSELLSRDERTRE